MSSVKTWLVNCRPSLDPLELRMTFLADKAGENLCEVMFGLDYYSKSHMTNQGNEYGGFSGLTVPAQQ